VSPRQTVFTIPTGVPFADALAAGLIARAGGEPLALSKMTVLLPNRRAARALAEAFLRRKLADDPTNSRYITTVRGVGLRFERGGRPAAHGASPIPANRSLSRSSGRSPRANS